jgi:hypothetical protein
MPSSRRCRLPSPQPPRKPKLLYYADRLRTELIERNRAYAARTRCTHHVSRGGVVLYPPSDDCLRHGNFLPETWQAIQENEGWRKRLGKAHTQPRSTLAGERRWRELDSCCSSDALLMNVFCHPESQNNAAMARLLNVDDPAIAEFGLKARVPLNEGKFDRTEVDMRLGHLLVEAKLTESDFQVAPRELLERYAAFPKVFRRRDLPHTRSDYMSYQLIRNVLAAHALGCAFCVLCDQRRPDLIEQWYAVMRCVKDADLRTRCKVLTWQELASVLPGGVRSFLGEKYGVEPA